MTGLIPEPGPLRPLALATLLSRVGNGLPMTVSGRVAARAYLRAITNIGVLFVPVVRWAATRRLQQVTAQVG